MYLIGKRLAELRKEKGLNQRELADEVGMHPAIISFLECNARGVNMNQAIKLSKYFDISIDELVADATQEPASPASVAA